MIQCGKAFGRQQHLDSHKCAWPCKNCGVHFRNHELYLIHQNECKLNTCGHCGMRFQKMYNLSRHEKGCIKSCKSCEQVIAMPMAEHLKSCPALKCVKCQKQIRQDKYISHTRSCKGRMNVCRLCKTSFKTGLELVEHLDSCGKFLCVICDREYSTKQELDSHKKSEHSKRKTGDGVHRRRRPDVFHCRFKDCTAEFSNTGRTFATQGRRAFRP